MFVLVDAYVCVCYTYLAPLGLPVGRKLIDCENCATEDPITILDKQPQ